MHIRSDNVLEIMMLSQGLDTEQSQSVWQPLLDWVKHSRSVIRWRVGS